MSARFLSFLSLAVGAAFLVVATQSFTLSVIGALALAFGIGMLVVSAGMTLRYRSQLPTVAAGVAIAAVSAWMVVASQVFTLSQVKDLTLAEALAVAVLAIVGLIVHELTSERIVHSLEVRAGEREPDEPRERLAA
jgi:hypothetical protein